MRITTARALKHYTIGGILFAIYGVQVCPFLDVLTPFQLFLPILVAFIVMIFLRAWFMHLYDSVAEKYVTVRQFWTDFGLFGMSGFVLAALNHVYYQAPPESGLKIFIGMLTLGYFISCDLALYTHRQLSFKIAAHGGNITPDPEPFPLTYKFSLFSACSMLAIGVIVFLVINKDLEWLGKVNQTIPMRHAQLLIVAEITFILAVLIGYILLIISSYAQNLNFFLSSQKNTLYAVGEGQLDVRVPVASNDEFGIIADQTNTMIHSLEHSTQELNQTRDVSIMALAILAETRDNETGSHILRTQHYVRILAEELRNLPQFKALLNDDAIAALFKSAPLHDIGKVGIPDAILLKPGKLTDDEFEIMKQHPVIGYNALKVAEERLGSNSFLSCARQISLTHHEKWDGSGYPNGLKGEEIPLGGRLMAVADVFDALISRRIYKEPFSYEKTREIILEGRGKHFDPDIVDAYIRCEKAFISIAELYKE